MELAEGMRLARAGRALLFLGAGFSCGTPNAGSGAMKSGRDFSDLLAAKVGLPLGTGLGDTSEAFLEEYGDVELVRQLISEFSATGLLDHQVAMSSVPWRQIYTTNYDDVVEKSFKARKYEIETINSDRSVASIPQRKAICVHLNGSILGLTPDKLENQIKLTDSSYLTSSIADSDWAVRFRQDVDAAQAVFYVGYSTYDLDIARLLFSKPSLRDKSFFVVGGAVGPILARRIEKFGTDTQLTAADFFKELVKDVYAPTTARPITANAVRLYDPKPSAIPLSDNDVFDLFRLGRVSQSLVFDSISGKQNYVLGRRAADRVIDLIKSRSAAVVVHSDFGNGKSIVLELIKADAFRLGFTVIEIFRNRESLIEELDYALKLDGQLLFVIDNYGDWREAIAYIGTHRNPNTSVILAARSGTNDVLASRIEASLKMGELYELPVDRLSDEDLARLADFMAVYGLWGERAGWSSERKLGFLAKHCGREWHSILIELFNAPQIKERLDRLINALQSNQSYSSIFISILLLAIVDHPATTDILTDLCGERTLTIGFRQNPTVRELIDFEADEVKLRSAVTGAFILQRVANPEMVLDTLVSVTTAADEAAAVSKDYLEILSAFMRFANAQNFFPEEVRNEFVLRYYEAVKGLRNCRRYPLFWLQYAIASLLADKFEQARTYFASAYSFAEQRPEFNTFQIDNHYARYLLRRAIFEDRPDSAMTMFREARQLIFDQVRNERLHYPYRVAALIGDWFDAFGDRVTPDERNEVKRAAGFIAARITELPEERQTHKDIAHCLRRMQAILATP